MATMRRIYRQCILLLCVALALAGCEVVSVPLPDTQTPAPPVVPPTIGGPTPTVAAIPARVLLQRALAARAAATDSATDLSTLIQTYPDTPEATQARYYLAESYAQRERWTSAAELLRAFLAAAPQNDPLRAPALFWLARAHESAGAHEAAIATYQQYRAFATPLAPYAALRQAAQARAIGQTDIITDYLSVARAPIVRGERASAFEDAIALLRETGRPTEALDLYVELLALAEKPSYKARILSEAAALAERVGQHERANDWLVALVAQAPDTPEAAAAADQLLAAASPALTPAAAGRSYFAAERWAAAVTQLDAALTTASDPEERADLGRLRGLALRAQDDFPAALAALAEAAAASPNGTHGRQAQFDWVQTLGQSGQTERAIQGYAEFASAYPDDALVPVALDRVVQLYERLGNAEGALQARLDVGRRYPTSDEGRVALHQAGLALFTAARYAEALQAWQTLADGNSGTFRARGAYWAGRTARAAGDEAVARTFFETARAAAPDSYEGARAAETLGGLPQGASAIGAAIAEPQWAELTAWVATWAGSVPTAPLAALGFSERARLLAEVGLENEASAEWTEALRVSERQPWANLRVARAAHEAGVPYTALLAAAALVAAAPPTASPPPVALRQLLFPTPYAALVQREAAARGLDPRLLYALLRQESLFNPNATSWVGARGLGQVMPATGQGIAQDLGVTDFTLDDLYQPAVSIRFSAFYLGQRIKNLGGSVPGALAAYNGGLGNAQRWAGGATIADADRFTEGIDYAETRGYVRAVYGFWGVYQGLYAP